MCTCDNWRLGCKCHLCRTPPRTLGPAWGSSSRGRSARAAHHSFGRNNSGNSHRPAAGYIDKRYIDKGLNIHIYMESEELRLVSYLAMFCHN